MADLGQCRGEATLSFSPKLHTILLCFPSFSKIIKEYLDVAGADGTVFAFLWSRLKPRQPSWPQLSHAMYRPFRKDEDETSNTPIRTY